MNAEMNNGANVTELVPGAVMALEPEKPALGSSVAGLDGASGEYVHKFKKPFEYEGKRYETLSFNFNRLVGRDMTAIEREMQMSGETAYTPETSHAYQCRLAARAAGIMSDVLEAMPLGDFNRITNATRNFLLATGY